MTRAIVFLLLGAMLVLVSGGARALPDEPPVAKKVEPKDDKGGFAGRTKEGKARLLKEFGGSEASEEAVMLGLAWLTQMQNKDGGWVYDAGRVQDTAPATGMAVLAFLGAGQSHKDGRYKQTMQAGIDWLVANLESDQGASAGKFKGAGDMYGQGIATLALVEAYGMTQDPALKKPAQSAIDYIQRAQAQNGSWGYRSGTPGDTSIVGWQVQALHAAKLTQGLVVDDKVIQKAIGFLNFAGTGRGKGQGQIKSMYGYGDSNGAQPATSLTAIGLLCRYYIDGWREENAGFAEGAKGLMVGKAPGVAGPRKAARFDLYYYYYSTQVIRYHGGEDWKDWNEGPVGADGVRKGGIPDWLIGLQDRKPAQRGSWNPEPGWFGQQCGRLGTTCMSLLTLEVYYRYSPGSNENEPKK